MINLDSDLVSSYTNFAGINPSQTLGEINAGIETEHGSCRYRKRFNCQSLSQQQ
jgi:hypothetical protein